MSKIEYSHSKCKTVKGSLQKRQRIGQWTGHLVVFTDLQKRTELFADQYSKVTI